MTEDQKYLEMYTEYLNGKTLKEIALENNLTPQAIHNGFKRRGWNTRKANLRRPRPSVIETIDDSELVAFKIYWNSLDSKVKGTIVESNVKSKLAELGFDVWVPYVTNQRADIGVFCRGNLIRIQVKCATYAPESKRFRCTLKTRDRNKQHIAYKSDEFDFFIVQCAGLQEFYVIPSDIGCSNPDMNMFPNRERIIRMQDGQVDWEIYRNAFHLINETC